MLDFGNATQLDERQQVNITRVMAAAATGHDALEHFVNGFKALLSEQGRSSFTDNEQKIRAMIDKVLSTGKAEDAGSRIFIILTKLQEMGVEIPGPIYAFCNRRIAWRRPSTA